MADKELFTWIPFYEEFAGILRGYHDKQGELIEFLRDKRREGLKVSPLPKGLTEIDPFSFYGAFNRNPVTLANRLAVVEAVKERFQIGAAMPTDFSSIPSVIAKGGALFFPSKPEKGHIEKLWHLYELSFNENPLDNSEFADAFDKAFVLPQVKLKLTMGLFWIRPKTFLNLDKPVRVYLSDQYPDINRKDIEKGFNFKKYKEVYDIVQKSEERGGKRTFYEISHEAFGYKGQSKKTKRDTAGSSVAALDKSPSAIFHNRILYGPPGTGKTYHTINEALRIIDGDSYNQDEDRTVLQKRFAELTKQQRIAFVTFHQSFSYEEFIEGLKADTDADGQVSYSVKDGIFKELCARAQRGKRGLSFAQCIERLKEECLENAVEMRTVTGNPIQVTYQGGETFRISPKRPVGEESRVYQPVSIPNMIKTYLGADSREFYNPHYIRAVINYIKKKYNLQETVNNELGTYIGGPEPYVLIIDEINRGNISAIFGELITLIESSKRAGAKEEISVILPYSKERFYVPANLYIVGTMNTADRSIALLDTALRRRFRFVEMMPKPELLEGVNVDGIEIRRLIETINQRIEALYDRDHQIGHTYFLLLKDEPTMEKLSDIFRHSILPLLQEYFYDNWEKINLVFNNNRFITAEDTPGMPSDDLIASEKKIWRIAEEGVFMDVEKYKSIYGK